jgi:pyridoxine 4-dehydrogenase
MHQHMTFRLGSDLPINRLGFGAMRLTGPGDWGPAEDVRVARRVARRAVELGVTFIDTADAYGPGTNEEFLADVLYPYPRGLVIATKVGYCRPSRHEYVALGRPEYLRQQAELSLRRLRVDCLDLLQLHRIDRKTPFADQLGALQQLREEGKVRHVGLSEVTVDEIEYARGLVDIQSVQNLYNLTTRRHDDVLEYCEREQLAFIPWLPLAEGLHALPVGPLAEVSSDIGAQPAQVALAWLLRRSRVMVPIPGTGSVAHLEQNVAAAGIQLSDEQFERLDGQRLDTSARR